jgi:hypothetical protein
MSSGTIRSCRPGHAGHTSSPRPQPASYALGVDHQPKTSAPCTCGSVSYAFCSAAGMAMVIRAELFQPGLGDCAASPLTK